MKFILEKIGFTGWSIICASLGIVVGTIVLPAILKKETICISDKDLVGIFPGALKESEKKEYLVSSAKFVTQSDSALMAYTRNTRIDPPIQNSITQRLFESDLENVLRDTVRGINFDFETVVKSMMEGQKANSIRQLKVSKHGIYIGFGYYPNTRPSTFPNLVNDSLYNSDFRNVRTAYINYTKIGSIIYLTDQQGNIIGDNVGMKCPSYCPTTN